MRGRQKDKEDDPFMASRCQHAQSELMCIAEEIKSKCVGNVYMRVLTLFIVPGK
jgi:hypothetical protein